MNPDFLAALIAWLRADAGLVAAFGDSAATPKFWADYAAVQDEVLPYLVLMEPQEAKSYETTTTGLLTRSGVSDGILTVEILAAGRLQARQLGEQASSLINDAPLVFAGGGLLYLRRLGQAFPVLAQTGPDGSPTIFKRSIQFRYLIETDS